MKICRPEDDQKAFWSSAEGLAQAQEYRKWSSDHYNITISILIVSSVVNARGGCGEADLC